MQIAGFSTRLVHIDLDSLAVDLRTVARLEDHVDGDLLLRDPQAPEPPYWAHLWPASRALARLLATSIECAGLRLLEVGCGLGLVGIVAARRSAIVTMFDHDEAGVAFARENLALNGVQATVSRLDLYDTRLSGPFDLICAADVTYDPSLQRALGELAVRTLAPNGRLLCTESVRTFDHDLRDVCAAHGLQVNESILSEVDEGRKVRVKLTEGRRA
jgi:predicted nicotinamide N-methyase